MLGQSISSAIGPETPCPTCRILDGGPFQDSQYPFPECPCPDGFAKQVVDIQGEDGAKKFSYRFCKPVDGNCIGKKAGIVKRPDQNLPDVMVEETGPDWFLILGGLGVAGLLYHRYKSLR
jgi:hypothetical protein